MTGIKWSIKEEQGLGSLEPSMVATVRTGPDNKRFILVLDSGLKKSYCKKSGQNKPCSNGFARGEKMSFSARSSTRDPIQNRIYRPIKTGCHNLV